MAAYFQSFWASNMPKRLLRYTLSKLDILDTDALDIDNLDLAVGKTSHVTLQNVGLKLKKLENLIQLPPGFEIQKATVLLLHVTVPSAIYSSPIVVEAEGVEIKLRVVSKEDTRHARNEGKRKNTNNEPRHDDPVPHAIDLAQSFLETQPSREKAELQAALNAETQDLAASVASSEEGSDEDSPLGTGQPLSLPAFLADFLQGVIDRVQVVVKGVKCHLDVEVPVEPNSSATEIATFQLSLDEINAEGVTMGSNSIGAGSSSEDLHKEGKRFVELRNVRAYLISEANVFSTFARTPSIPSSDATNSPVLSNRRFVSRESTSLTGSEMKRSPDESTHLEGSHYHQPLMDSEDAFNIPYDLDHSSQEPEDGEDDADLRSTPSTPRALAAQTPPRNISRHPFTLPAQAAMEAPLDHWSSFERTAHSEHTVDQSSPWGEDSFESSSVEDSPPALGGGEITPSPNEDLAQSHLFSHQDAESMYMSAFSHAESSQIRQAMPGAWDSEPLSIESSPSDKLLTSTEPPSESAEEREPQAVSNDQSPIQHETDPFHDSLPEQPPVVDNLEEAVHTHSEDTQPSEELVADEAETPKGPTRLVKELVSLESVILYIPSGISPTAQETTSGQEASTSPHREYLERSGVHHVPGAFSVYAGTQSTAAMPPLPSTTYSETPIDQSLEIILSPMDVRTDLSTGFLLSTAVSRILSVLKDRSKPLASDNPTVGKSSSDIQLTAERISIHFLETLAGVADTTERVFNPSPDAFEVEALLSTTVQDLKVGISGSESSTTTSVDIGKFKFGYGNDDIVSFDQRIQMRASVKDAFPSAGADMSLSITQSADSTRCELKTLPLHVKLDLQRLDETFSWFGGLSSFLNMSSSMTSNASPITRSPTRTPKKPRGVRFDAPIRPDDVSASAENKMNARIGGLRLDLIGKECSVSLDTSAVKLVSREEGVGIGISKIQISGPYMRRSMGDPPVSAVIMNTRVEYLVTPNDNDLERLLELIIPSKHKFDQGDDEIMVDTLLRQRRKGAVLRINADDFEVNVTKVQQLQVLPVLGEELARLSTVAKYLPEDDRPGILTLALIRNTDVTVDVGGKLGSLQASIKELEAGHITIPSLVAVGVGTLSLRRNHSEDLVGTTVPPPERATHGPVVTMRIIGDEMEPIVKLRMRHLKIEYRVPTIMDVLDLAEDVTPQDFETSLAASVANLGEHAHAAITGKQSAASSDSAKGKNNEGKPTKVDLVFRDCTLGLNPLGLPSKMVIVLTDAHLEVALSNGDDAKALGHINKASILLVDDVSLLASKELPSTSRRRVSTTSTPQVVELCQRGYVDICYVSSAQVTVRIGSTRYDDNKWVDIEVRDDLLVLETCADSTQTLITLANALAPPTPPSKENKYRTKVVPVQDLLASISADAFGSAESDYDFDNDFGLAEELGGNDDLGFDLEQSGGSSPLDVDSDYYAEPPSEDLLVGPEDSVLSERTTAQDTSDGVLLTNFSSQPDDMDDEDLVIDENFFGTGSTIKGTAHRWSSAKNAYDSADDAKGRRNPITVRVRDVHFIWNLFDGYDWDHTRETISKAVYDIETTAIERQSRHDRTRTNNDMEVVEEETVIGDFLFNSIYIGIPANRDPRELAQAINQELNDNATETESIATTAMTATPSRQGGAYRTKKKLKLNRSKRHKITFELKGINVDLVTFPPGSGETQSSIDVRVQDLDVFDHVPTSTWKKFATYDQDSGEREMGTSMVHLEIMNVKPLPELAASEIVLKATVLPLRLHVDQDALDFITRFFEFKDDSAPPTHASPSDIPFVQRAEINDIPVKLDFKPKRVDYAGLRSGHTTEFMNFLVLDEARMVMRHTIIYGVSGFDRLGKTLNDIWMPDVKRNQLPGVLAGLAPVRSLVNVGSGFKDLIEIPVKEYKKDGRIVRSIGKGAAAFAKTTGTEIVKLGAKLAVGTQHALQGAEGILAKQPEVRDAGGWDEEDLDTEETKQISLYADQPTGVVQGLRGAYSSLARDLNVARDAIIAVPGEVMDSQSAQGAARAVLKRAPTIIFRPLIGSTKAIGQTLMGATNSLDPQNRRRVDEKYKKY